MRSMLFTLLITGFLAGNAFAQESEKKEVKKDEQTQDQVKKQNQKFVDLDGDGFNDNAPDHDGDGIPNGLDPDWQKQQEKFVDMDGDGINDNAFQEQNQNRKQMTGPANGSSRQMGTPEVKTPGQQEQKKGQKGKKD